MLILGIETSCDETAAAVVENGTRIVSHVKATSLKVNQKYGGVVPDKTAREQLKCILPIISEATAQVSLEKIDAIAVTYGPGLIGSLLVGVETAKTLALALNKPIVPINHLIGHIYANWLEPRTQNLEPPSFPALVLLVSGGHTELILMSDHGKFKLLGTTRDDAAGECFDKCGRLLGLPYPYGPFIEGLATKYNLQNSKYNIHLPRPLMRQKNWDFSFSGLKTAFLYEFQNAQKSQTLTDDYKAALAHELEEAVTDVLVTKFVMAAKEFKATSLILAGGVAANKKLRHKLLSVTRSQLPQVTLHIPPISLCTDNAAYIASAAYFNYRSVPWEKVAADPSLTI